MQPNNEILYGFGNQLFSCDMKNERRIVKIVLSLVMPISLIFIIAFLVLIGNALGPDVLPDPRHIQGFAIATTVFIFTPVILISLTFKLPASAATVYENGLVLKRGSKTTALHFHDIENIKLTPFDPAKVLKDANTVTIIKVDGSKPVVARVPNFNDFSDSLDTAFTRYKKQNA